MKCKKITYVKSCCKHILSGCVCVCRIVLELCKLRRHNVEKLNDFLLLQRQCHNGITNAKLVVTSDYNRH